METYYVEETYLEPAATVVDAEGVDLTSDIVIDASNVVKSVEGELMSGDWIITGHTLKYSRNEVISFEDNHINVLTDGGKVHYLKVFNHSLVEFVNVVVSVY